MDQVQTNRSNEALVTAIRANLCEFYRHLGRSVPEGCYQDGKFTRWWTSLQHPWFNGVLSSRPPEENDEAFVEETIAYFRSQGVGAFTWWMEPRLDASAWEPLLSKYGFGFSDDTPGMAADLEALDEAVQTTEGLEVRAVDDEESLRTWTHIFALGYGLSLDWEPSIYEVERKLGLGFPVQNYLGILHGQPVATSCLFFGRGVAGIYSVSTLVEARGKGVGAAMTLIPLQEAREMGYRIGVLQSSEMGYNIYKKLGFRHLCPIEYFYRMLR